MLFQPLADASLQLRNRIVMAPITGIGAAEGNRPSLMMAEYYSHRATAGLVITEGTSPSPNGLGSAHIPWLFNDTHIAGWKQVADAVHARGGKIFLSLLHTGRVSHVDSLPDGAEVVGPTSLPCPGEIHTDTQGMQAHSVPRAMTQVDIAHVAAEYAKSAEMAISAGFDGVELHAADGYLVEQFLNANVNQRTDRYGGSIHGRNRFALEVLRAMVDAIGAHRVGIRLSPYGVVNSTGAYADLEAQYLALIDAMAEMGILYVHLLDHSALGAPPVPDRFKFRLRVAFAGIFILTSGFDRVSADYSIGAGLADLIGFERPSVADPDFVERIRTKADLNALDKEVFYALGPKGYSAYPSFTAHQGH
jgi:N-ethylmaleimide reductase